MESVLTSMANNLIDGQYTILIVEDDPSLREGIHDLLEYEDGTTIYSASDGLEAMEQLQTITPDLIISDIMMPHMNGFQLLEEVRAIPKFVRIPFIFLTARGSREEVFEGKKSGAEMYITKPFNPNELIELVKTQLQRASEKKLANQEDISSLKRTVLQILNHEFRTPLTYVTAYYDMLADSIESQMDGRNVDDYLNGILSGCERLIDLIEDLIMVMDVRGGNLSKAFYSSSEPISGFNDVIQAAVESKRTILEKYNIDVDFQPINEPYEVWGVQNQIAILLGHLIENAIKFTTYTAIDVQSGKILITVKPSADEKWLTFTITDSGIGFPNEVQDKIFELFYQHNRQHFEQQGSGAGLTIAQGISDILGGRLSVESIDQQGCTATLELPIYNGEQRSLATEKSESSKRYANILLVEDDQVLLESLEELMLLPNENYQINVKTAANGKLALEVLETFVPDLIISDMVMPEIDGFELIKQTRLKSHLLNVPFIIVSAKNRTEDILAGRKSGAEEYITKPYDSDEFLMLVNVQLDRFFEHKHAIDQDFDNFKQKILSMLQPDFRAPLQSVSEKSNELSGEHVSINTADDLRSTLEEIHEGSERISELVEDFMSLAEIETGEAFKAFDSRSSSCFDFSYLIADTISYHRKAFLHNQIEVVQILANDGAGAIIEHASMLKSINRLVGIVTAFCIAAEGDQISIEVACGDNDDLKISVWHNGNGLTEEENQNIQELLNSGFADQFNPMDFSSHFKIVDGFVKIHKGTFRLLKEPNIKADKFVISLPKLAPPSNLGNKLSGFTLQ